MIWALSQQPTMDCHNLNFPDETFDMVICRNITWTLDDPQKAYKEWLRVLKKGGRLLVSDACWYLHLYDEEKKKIYEAHDAAMWEKYGRGIHAHEDAETGKELSSKLFMSDKKRPNFYHQTKLFSLCVLYLHTKVTNASYFTKKIFGIGIVLLCSGLFFSAFLSKCQFLKQG